MTTKNAVQIQVTLPYTGEVLSSEWTTDPNDETLEKIHVLCEHVAKGEVDHFYMTEDNGTKHYFPAELLSLCVISVVRE